jgi:hypothetical protein
MKRLARQNREIMTENRRNPDGEFRNQPLPLKDEPAILYRQMVDAGILGIIQSSTIPIRASVRQKEYR